MERFCFSVGNSSVTVAKEVRRYTHRLVIIIKQQQKDTIESTVRSNVQHRKNYTVMLSLHFKKSFIVFQPLVRAPLLAPQLLFLAFRRNCSQLISKVNLNV